MNMSENSHSQSQQADQYSPLIDGIKNSSSHIIVMQPHHFNKKQRNVHFNQVAHDQCQSPVKVGAYIQQIENKSTFQINNRNRKIVLGSIDKFLLKAQKMQRQLISSYHIRSTMNPSKTKKKLYQTPMQFVENFRQTMTQLKILLSDVRIFINEVKKIFDQGKYQLTKFQQTIKESSCDSKIKQPFNIHNLSGEIQKIPIINIQDQSLNTDRMDYPLLTPRTQGVKDNKVAGKIIKTQRRMSSQLLKNGQPQGKEKMHSSFIESRGDYNKVSFQDINLMTNNMKKLLDML